MAKQQTVVKPVKDETPETTETAAPAETKTRKMLTPAERVAKLEADLAEAKAKAEAKDNKAKAEATTKRATLIEKRDALTEQIRSLTVVIGDGPSNDEG